MVRGHFCILRCQQNVLTFTVHIPLKQCISIYLGRYRFSSNALLHNSLYKLHFWSSDVWREINVKGMTGYWIHGKRWEGRGKFNKYAVNIYLFKFNNKNSTKRCEICSKLKMKTNLVSSASFNYNKSKASKRYFFKIALGARLNKNTRTTSEASL